MVVLFRLWSNLFLINFLKLYIHISFLVTRSSSIHVCGMWCAAAMPLLLAPAQFKNAASQTLPTVHGLVAAADIGIAVRQHFPETFLWLDFTIGYFSVLSLSL